MPLAADPNQTADVSLESESSTPEPQRAVFIYRFLTARQALRRIELVNLANKAEGTELLKPLVEAVGVGLVGWRNIVDADGNPIPFTGADGLLDVLTLNELWELAYTAGRAVMEVEAAKKKPSQSSSPTDTKKSAPTAAPPAAA